MHSGKIAIAAFALSVAAFTSQPASASQCGMASWYTDGQTASGERLVSDALTAAHRTLPFGTRVKVENMDNGRSVTVRINDRGPFIAGRVIDVTRGAAQALGMINAGVAAVRVTVLDGGKQLTGCG